MSTMECPTCKGQKHVIGLPVGSADTSGAVQHLTCPTCDGTGQVDGDYPLRLAQGQAYRKDRLETGTSLFERAKALEIT